MRDVLPTLEQWRSEGSRFATATVTQTWGSSPRPVGSVMGVREDGLVVGSVSGGCVESSVIEASKASLQDGRPRQLTFEGVSDESVWQIGLSCGGRIEVWIDPDPGARSTWQPIVEAIDGNRPVVLLTRIEPFEQRLWHPGESDGPASDAYRARHSGVVQIEGQPWFAHVLAARERLIVVGAVHIAIPLVRFARQLGFETVVVDPRRALAQETRFGEPPDRLICDWPEKAFEGLDLDDECFAVVLTHDPKIDDVALALLLRSPVAYVGALGSRTTQAKRRADLLQQGFTEDELSRIHGPVGLDIGARTPEEIALSIVAEIVMVRRGKS